MQKKSRENCIVFRQFRSRRNGKFHYIIGKRRVLHTQQKTVIIGIQTELTNLSFFNSP